jgi:hypothetical protein
MKVQLKGLLLLILLVAQPPRINSEELTESEREDLQKSAETHEF